MNTGSHSARKRFGQNFLHDQGVIERIIAAFAPRDCDQVVEIGPGLGALTLPLFEAIPRLHVVELDRDLVARLQANPAYGGQLVIHQADALKFDFCTLAQDNKLRIIGNLPYNISTPLLFHLLEQAYCIEDMYLMLQKEVVDRLLATPGTKNYGRLSVMVQWQCDVNRILDVGPGAFRPAPKVSSAVVRLTPLQQTLDVGSRGTLTHVVKAAFCQRRKTLRNTLKGIINANGLMELDIDAGRRAETLSLQEFARIARAVHGTGQSGLDPS
ncbi:MAG: 16S rRNA (adenine(1518)-N(6)/adenine(1519)-N(6)) -dimethyltransferase RsmA [Gammaproteobacteria bacterium]|nr:MAG: 16S rRNA (adenine(1518)-N(6)/adenine(1519)-N(6)) -dimethyltransferase RsmA [Gammaproteobacteria bacterium]